MEFGATHAFASMDDAMPEVMEMTHGEMADKVIMTPGVMYGDLMELVKKLTGKGGTMRRHRRGADDADRVVDQPVQPGDVQQGGEGDDLRLAEPSVGHPPPARHVPGRQLKLDELITNRYSLDEINEGYQAMREGKNIRGVIVYD